MNERRLYHVWSLLLAGAVTPWAAACTSGQRSLAVPVAARPVPAHSAPAGVMPADSVSADSWHAAPVEPASVHVDWAKVGHAIDVAVAEANPEPASLSIAEDLLSTATREAAARDSGQRLVISLRTRKLWWLDGPDTVLSAPVSIGRGTILQHGNHAWEFSTPRGKLMIKGKRENPVWVPPDWYYVEVAQKRGLQLAALEPERTVVLRDGSRLKVRGEEIGLVSQDSGFVPLPAERQLIVFDSTLFIPPFGTRNRKIPGTLGAYKLELGDGYLIHGSAVQAPVGVATTHGCVRLRNDDLRTLYELVPLGARVYIY